MRAPTGAKMMAASNFSGGASSDPPAQVAPRCCANFWFSKSPARVKAKTSRPSKTATFAKTNKDRKQQLRGRDIVELLGKMKTKAGVGNGEFRVTPVHIVAGESRTIAKILPTGPAKFASAASPTQPRNADAIARAKCFHRAANLLDPANNFVAGN